MSDNTESLERLKLWTQIIASIALPTVLFVIGNQVQQSIAEREVGKNYVQMAIEILKQPPSKEATDLRQWAVATVDKFSPIPFSSRVREQLKSGEVELKSDPNASIKGKPTGLVRYIECRKGKDRETVEWLLKHTTSHEFYKCPKDDELGIAQYKIKQGPLKSGEIELTGDLPRTNRLDKLGENIRSIECVKAKNKETVEWVLKQYPDQFYKCPMDDELGMVRYKNI